MDFEVIIIGCGPAGLQAAIHASRRKAKTIVIGHPERSVLIQAEVENYFGLDKISGKTLIAKGLEQVRRFGGQIMENDVLKAEKVQDWFVVSTDDDQQYRAKALILAIGVSRKKSKVPGETEWLGKGVSYCASCDCGFFRGRKVVVVGDESMAATSAILMTEYASEVYWVASELKVAPQLMEKVRATKTKILSPTSLAKIEGTEVVTGVELNNGTKLEVQGVFIELGASGTSDLAFELGLVPEADGTLKVKEDMGTEIAGLYACGDVTGEPWQLARAVGQGAVAGAAAAKFAKLGAGAQ